MEINKILNNRFNLANDGNQIDNFDLIFSNGKASSALLYSVLFCPNLTEYEGSVLLYESIQDENSKHRFLKYRDKNGSQNAESSFNFIEVPYLFDAENRDLTDDEDIILAKMIKKAWEAWLHYCYREKNFVVEVLSPDVTGSVVGVHFYEKRSCCAF